VRAILLRRNSGQHQAIMAAFERARGDVIVTLDADLQNPPEEIPKLVAAIEQGHDVAGGYRAERQDSVFRTWPSRVINHLRAATTGIEMKDHGCMLRAYRKEIVQQIVTSRESAIYIPALAQHFAANPAEVEVRHAPRTQGVSKYNLYRLIRLNFDLMTGFTLLPLQLFTVFGMAVAALALLLVVYLAFRRLFIGPEVEGVFTLFGILYFLIGIGITGLGIVGEYVGRIYQEVRRRPAYQVQAVHERLGDP
jgi:undecaprenyl-phosphate 4-deoxy-4-formamido-L-arabinose transferase